MMKSAILIPRFSMRVAFCATFLILTSSHLVFADSSAASTPVPANDSNGDTTSGRQGGRLSVIEENDYFASHDDRHYTQGLRASYLFGTNASDNAKDCDWIGDGLTPFESGKCKRKYEWTVVGQNLYTPENLNVSTQNSKDRPYGAWLYTGLSLLEEHKAETHTSLDNFEIQGGVVGPLALGAETQDGFHKLIGDQPSYGWNNQIHTEPGVVLADERKWRFEAPISGNFGADFIPEVGITAGNIFDYAETSGVIRIGQNLRADYGQNRIRPSISGTGWFDKDALNGDLGWNLFFGSQGRAVGRNLFLDGNTFESSPNVQKKDLVADFVAGASVFWSTAARIDFSVTERTREFYGQQGAPDRFGSITAVFGF